MQIVQWGMRTIESAMNMDALCLNIFLSAAANGQRFQEAEFKAYGKQWNGPITV